MLGDGGGGVGEARGEEAPGQKATEDEYRVLFYLYSQYEGEDHGKEEHQDQGLKQCPEDPKDRALIPHLEVSEDEILEKFFVLKEQKKH